MVNAGNASETISVAFRTPDGTVTQGSVSNLPPQGHLAFPLPQPFPALSGQSGLLPPYMAAAFSASFPNVTLNGQTLTFGGFQPGSGGAMRDAKLTQYGITSASLSLTLTPQSVPTTGSVSGSLSLTSSLATLSGPVTGTYILSQ